MDHRSLSATGLAVATVGSFLRKPVHVEDIKEGHSNRRYGTKPLFSAATMNTSNDTNIPPFMLPNPYTPLAWIPPDAAYQLDVARYIVTASAGV